MKKILLSILLILLCVLLYFVIFNGISIGNFEISSAEQISNDNDKLDESIEKLNTLSRVTYEKKNNELTKQIKELSDKKNEYLDKANLSSPEEIKLATQEESYKMEYLWTKLGNYATEKGVNLRFEVVNGIDNYKNLNFTLTGSYVAIIDYISAIENDTELNFTPVNFKMVNNTGDTSQGKLQATFTVESIPIVIEKVESNSTDENSDDKNTVKDEEDKKENTNTVQEAES